MRDGYGSLEHTAKAPASVLLVAQQRGKACRGIEARNAQPVDAPVFADERARVQIADQRIVLELHSSDFFPVFGNIWWIAWLMIPPSSESILSRLMPNDFACFRLICGGNGGTSGSTRA